jgi:hypothetical protein
VGVAPGSVQTTNVATTVEALEYQPPLDSPHCSNCVAPPRWRVSQRVPHTSTATTLARGVAWPFQVAQCAHGRGQPGARRGVCMQGLGVRVPEAGGQPCLRPSQAVVLSAPDGTRLARCREIRSGVRRGVWIVQQVRLIGEVGLCRTVRTEGTLSGMACVSATSLLAASPLLDVRPVLPNGIVRRARNRDRARYLVGRREVPRDEGPRERSRSTHVPFRRLQLPEHPPATG